MMDIVTEYLSGSSHQPLYIGAMAGTQVFQHILNIAEHYTNFASMLIVEGIQDIIGLRRESPFTNHIFYAEMFHNKMIELRKDLSTLEGFFNEKPRFSYTPELNTDIRADIIIINDAHMIPKIYLDQILQYCNTKLILIVDPYDINGELYRDVNTVTETLTASSNLIAKARSLYDIETYAVDKRVISVLDTAKMMKRSIGKIDDNQYVTNNDELLQEINYRQSLGPFKRRQKILVTDNHIITSPTITDDTPRECILVKHSIAYIMGAVKDLPYIKLRPHSYKTCLFGRPTYDQSDDEKTIHCKPANILSIYEASYHRFQRIVCVVNEKSLTVRQMYSLLKNTNHLTLIK